MRASLIFDGNDWQATHIVVYDGEEPVGTVRIRWFRDFAQFERTAFRKEWRNPHVIKACAQFAFDHVARKGFERVITHAGPLYARLWRMLLGFTPVEGKGPLLLEGHPEPYVELEKLLERPANALGLASDANTLFRIEGAWDEPGAHEDRP
ncbi:GNAT family N-acetyltransferase [Afifella pfennigii]|uniref:GNAT family N-acetyltransferase n=1 Tax=Afifella pfennigii TaxID=209897 RepID=UPI000691FC0C|nr:GNAT family N-acetyltransferase [Afifella pfennigii]